MALYVIQHNKGERGCRNVIFFDWRSESLYDRGMWKKRSKDNRYSIWRTMRSRCLDPARPKYPIYGGRGIKVCDRWLDTYEGNVQKPSLRINDGFANFCADMGERPIDPTSKTGALCSIDRIDNEKGYSPENCRWATAIEQANNRRPSRGGRTYPFRGGTYTLAEVSKITGLSYNTLHKRIHERGWESHAAFTEPMKRHHKPRT